MDALHVHDSAGEEHSFTRIKINVEYTVTWVMMEHEGHDIKTHTLLMDHLKPEDKTLSIFSLDVSDEEMARPNRTIHCISWWWARRHTEISLTGLPRE